MLNKSEHFATAASGSANKTTVTVRMQQKSPVPTKILSGGQTGVDRAALDAAISLGIEHGGWCPSGRLAEDGTIPESYNLRQTKTRDYSQRTENNVLDSDATLIVCHGKPGGGTLLTAKLAKRHEKPLWVVDLDEIVGKDVAHTRATMFEWLEANRVATLNVAGPRESQFLGIHREAFDLLTRIFRK